MKNRIKTLILITVSITYLPAFSQSICKDALYEANKLFESGNIKECIEKLEPCLQTKKDKEEYIESYHLLAQAYQNLNDIPTAQKYIRKMLLIKPDYQKFPNIDPLDFSRLINQYKVDPKFYLGLKAGINRNSVALQKSYSTYASEQSYNPQTGFQLGITADYRIKPSVSFNADLLYSGLGINHVVNDAGGWEQNYTEQQNYALLNVSLQKYLKPIKQIQFFGGIGLGLGYLTSSNVFLEATNIETKSVQQSTQNPIATRNRMQTSLNGVIGISSPVFIGNLSLETNFCYFTGNTVNADKRMDDLNFIFNNQYVNDDVSLRLMMVNLSYKIPLIYRVGLKK